MSGVEIMMDAALYKGTWPCVYSWKQESYGVFVSIESLSHILCPYEDEDMCSWMHNLLVIDMQSWVCGSLIPLSPHPF